MTSKEALHIIRDELKYVIDDLDTYDRKIDNAYKQIKKYLELLDLYKKFFKYGLIEIQWYKYLTLPNSDIRRPDSMIKITNEEYELLKEGLEND